MQLSALRLTWGITPSLKHILSKNQWAVKPQLFVGTAQII